jgi:ABC-type multidrug transport system fused ATPase/permease subunit
LVYASIALIISSACSLAQPYFFGEIINACNNQDSEKLKRVILTLSIIFVVGGIFTFIRGYLYSLVGERLVRVIRKNLFECIIRQDISFFDINKTGELMNRLSADTTVIQSCLSVNVSMGLRSAAMIFVSTILLFVTSWKLTLVVTSISLPSLLLLIFFPFSLTSV